MIRSGAEFRSNSLPKRSARRSFEHCFLQNGPVSVFQVLAATLLGEEARSLSILCTCMKLVISANEPWPIKIRGRMREPNAHLLRMAVWAFKILELAPLRCQSEAGELSDVFAIGALALQFRHSEQPHTCESRCIHVKRDRLPASRERPYPLDQAIGKIGCRSLEALQCLTHCLLPFHRQFGGVQ